MNTGSPIVTIVDFTDTWVRAAIPETYADHIGIRRQLARRLPGGTITRGKVFFKAVEADFATQRDVSRRKRDIKTIVLKVRLNNPKGAYVPGMTANVLVSPDQINGKSKKCSRSGAALMASRTQGRKAGVRPLASKSRAGEAREGSTDTNAIEVNHIVKKYGDFTAVDDVSFYVKEGEIFGLLGPNGAGKSTLIRMMTTLIPITSGNARIAGHDVAKDPNAARRISE